MNLLHSAVPEFLGSLAAGLVITLATWGWRTLRARRAAVDRPQP